MSTPGAGLQFEVGQFSHAGIKRTKNEDWLGAFRPQDAPRLASKGSLFLVADGMGGHQSGELASRRAVDHVIRTYVDDPTPDVGASLEQAIASANTVLHAASQNQEGRRWGTTLVAAVIRRGELWIANVGDSRAYLLRGTKLRQLSRDHSWAASQSGANLHGDWLGRHVITRALGTRKEVEVDLFPPLKLRDGDRVLLCSDGLTTPLTDEEILAIARRRTPQQAAENLIQAANGHGGPDNVSVILIQVGRYSQSLAELLVDLVHPAHWPGASARIQRMVREGDSLQLLLLLVLLLVVVLALIGLGFVLGLLIL